MKQSGVALVNLVLQPRLIPSSIAPPIMRESFFSFYRPAPRWLAIVWRAWDASRTVACSGGDLPMLCGSLRF